MKKVEVLRTELADGAVEFRIILDAESADAVKAGAQREEITEANFVASAITVRIIALAEIIQARSAANLN